MKQARGHLAAAELAAVMGLSPSRVSQLSSRAIAKLRKLRTLAEALEEIE